MSARSVIETNASRISCCRVVVACANEAGAGAAASEDRDWSEYFDAMLIANPRLSTEQRRAIEVDYAMTEGFVKLSIRYALLYYFHKRLGADFAPTLLDADGEPRETPIVIENLSDYITALGRVGVRKR